MSLKESLKDGKKFYLSKGVWGGVVLFAVAAWEVYNGNYTNAIETFGMGLSAIGIRMAQK